MSKYQVENALQDLDKAMSQLRESMKGLQIRTAGFKKDHDNLAKRVGSFTVDLADSAPLTNT